jgi:hypothetical protein
VYRRRRLVVLVALLLVVAGVTLAIWQPWRAAGGTGGGPTPVASASPSAIPTSPSAVPTASAEPSPTATPSPTTTGIAACTSGSVSVEALTDRESYGSGQLPQLSIALTNEGDVPCVINVGTTTQSFTISSGNDVWWRSTDCQSAPSDQIVQLEVGQTVTSVTPLVWDRTRSSVDSCDGDRPDAWSGYYNLVVAIGGIESESRQFRLR